MNIKTFTLAALLCTMAISCQKETIVVEPVIPVADTKTTYTVRYSIDGVIHYGSCQSETEIDTLYNSLMDLAQDGSTIIIYSNNQSSQATQTRDVVTYSTSNKSDAVQWIKKMILLGYDVVIEYDEETGMFNCTATKEDK